jgi:GMP synthase-like glutamine amidotransferase
MTTVTVLRHVAFEDLGILEELFKERGWKTTYIEAPVADWRKFDPLKADLLVILGGPIGVYEEDIYTFSDAGNRRHQETSRCRQADAWHLSGCAVDCACFGRQRLSGPGKGNRLEAASIDGHGT